MLVSSGGNMSVMVAIVSQPLFVTVILYCRSSPGPTRSGVLSFTLTIARSSIGGQVTCTCLLSMSFAGFASPLTMAATVIDPGGAAQLLHGRAFTWKTSFFSEPQSILVMVMV